MNTEQSACSHLISGLWSQGSTGPWFREQGESEVALLLEASQLEELVNLEAGGGVGGTQAPSYITSPTAGSSFLDSQESAQRRALGSDCLMHTQVLT